MRHPSSSRPIRSRVFGAWPIAMLAALALSLAGFSAAEAAGTVTNCASYGTPQTVGDLAWALQNGGTVSFACNGNIVVPEITITLDTTIDGTGQIVGLSGNGSNRVLIVSGGARLDLIRLTVTGGNVESGSGGGIYAGNPSTVTLTNSTVFGNTAAGGGGIYVGTSSTVTLTNSTISGNLTPGLGGGIYAANSSTVTLTNSTVLGNTALIGGGGIYAGTSSNVTLTNSAVRANASAGVGGGIQALGATVLLENSTLNGSTVGTLGGGLFSSLGVITLKNSTVSGNTSAGAGGGIVTTTFDVVTLANSTVSANGAVTTGGGLSVCGNCAVSLVNSIVAGNTAGTSGPDCTGSPASLGYNLIGNTSGCSFSPGTGDLVNVAPLLGPLQNNGGPTLTHALLPGSPAIDAASPSCPPPATDQRGTPRPQGAACDIGAYELAVTSQDTVTISWSIFFNIFRQLFIVATSTERPAAALSLTVEGCPEVTNAPMSWTGRTYLFLRAVRTCGNLDGKTATVTSSYGGMATATIR